MMYFLSSLVIIFMCFNFTLAYATAPSNVSVEYNVKSNNLYVRADHVSSRLERHYIRKMVISINDEIQDTVYYPRQKAPWGFEGDVYLKAKPKDKITVEIYCSQGGTGSSEITVPELNQEQGNP